MIITILNGNSADAGTEFDHQAMALAKTLGKEHTIHYFPLQEMDIRQCIGCWSCWWKTPGLCTHKDDAGKIYQAAIQSDLLIFASPIIAGFPSSVLKTMMDRLIILVHPYILLIDGECHHKKRYSKYPELALFLAKEEDTDEEDMQIINNIFDRLGINLHSKRRFTWTTDTNKPEEIAYELTHI